MLCGDTAVIEDQADKDAVDGLGLEPWQPGVKANYIRLTACALTGRRSKVNRPDVWAMRQQDRRWASFELAGRNARPDGGLAGWVGVLKGQLGFKAGEQDTQPLVEFRGSFVVRQGGGQRTQPRELLGRQPVQSQPQ